MMRILQLLGQASLLVAITEQKVGKEGCFWALGVVFREVLTYFCSPVAMAINSIKYFS